MTKPLLETRGLTRRFGGVTAVDSVDFTLAKGELRCLIGPNGAGKSTFFKMLCGLLAPSEGDIFLNDKRITGRQRYEIAARGVGIKTQVPSLYDGLTTRESVELALLRRMSPRAARPVCDDLLARLSLSDVANRNVGELSHGQRQWVELAIVLGGDPSLILLDEPIAGMTQEEVGRTAQLVRELSSEHAMVIVEHDMKFVRMIASKVTVFHQGRILAEDDIDTILADERVRDVYLGKKATAHA